MTHKEEMKRAYFEGRYNDNDFDSWYAKTYPEAKTNELIQAVAEKFIHRFTQIKENHEKALLQDDPESNCASYHRGSIEVLEFVIDYIKETLPPELTLRGKR